MQFSRAYRKLKGFTLIESILGIMVIGLVSSSIMVGITTVEKKLFKIRLKEQAFETLRNYTNFLGSRIAAGDIPGKPEDSGFDIAIYQHERNNVVDDVYTANMNYKEIKTCCSEECCSGSLAYDVEVKICGVCDSEIVCNGLVYYLETFIYWPNESDFQDTLRFKTFQIELTK